MPAYLEKVICQAHVSKDSRIIATKGDRYTMIEHRRNWVGRDRRRKALSRESVAGIAITQEEGAESEETLPKFHC